MARRCWIWVRIDNGIGLDTEERVWICRVQRQPLPQLRHIGWETSGASRRKTRSRNDDEGVSEQPQAQRGTALRLSEIYDTALLQVYDHLLSWCRDRTLA